MDGLLREKVRRQAVQLCRTGAAPSPQSTTLENLAARGGTYNQDAALKKKSLNLCSFRTNGAVGGGDTYDLYSHRAKSTGPETSQTISETLCH